MPPLAVSADSGVECLDLWKAINGDYRKAVESGKYKTIIIDPATIVWDIIKNAYEYERSKGKLLRRDYGVPNARMLGMLVSPIVSGINLVSVNYIRDVYVGDQTTGEKDIDGFKQTDGICDIIIFCSMVGQKEKSVVKSKIVGNRFDRTLNGFEMTDATYQDLLDIIGV